jgi:hypothetical protein
MSWRPRTVQASVFEVMRVLARALRILIHTGAYYSSVLDSYVSVPGPEAAMGCKSRVQKRAEIVAIAPDKTGIRHNKEASMLLAKSTTACVMMAATATVAAEPVAFTSFHIPIDPAPIHD